MSEAGRSGGTRERVTRAVKGAAGRVPRRPAVAQLRHRVTVLEREMQEQRRLNRRVAELTDIVQELLVPLADRDEEAVRRKLAEYSRSL